MPLGFPCLSASVIFVRTVPGQSRKREREAVTVLMKQGVYHDN